MVKGSKSGWIRVWPRNYCVCQLNRWQGSLFAYAFRKYGVLWKEQKKIIKLCYLQIAFYVVFLTSLLPHFKRGLDHRAFALLIILTLLGCASALTLTDYLKSLIRRSGF